MERNELSKQSYCEGPEIIGSIIPRVLAQIAQVRAVSDYSKDTKGTAIVSALCGRVKGFQERPAVLAVANV